MRISNIIGLGIGEDILREDNLSSERLNILNDIYKSISKIKDRTYNDSKKNEDNNFISLLGGRGSGKTSMILTILNKVETENSYLENSKSEKKIEFDFILPKIDPLMFNLEKNALGWIIYSFDERMDNINELNESKYCDKLTNKIRDLNKFYQELKTNYIISREFYRDNLHALSQGIYEYKKVNEDIVKGDLKLQESFKDFINSYVETILFIFEDEKHNREEPYIFISFDDIDIRPQYGSEILDTIIKYLKHKNIIVLVSGDHNTFKESLFIDLLNKQATPEGFKIDSIIVEQSLKEQLLQRSDDILNKVLPPMYRNNLNGLSILDRLLYTPYGCTGESIAQFLYNFKIESNEGENSLLYYFINPLVNYKGIQKEFGELDKKNNINERTYEGYLYDRKAYEDSVVSLIAYKYLVKLYECDDEGTISGELLREFSDEVKKENIELDNIQFLGEIKEKSEEISDKMYAKNLVEKYLLSKVQLNSLGNLLPDSPRGLINLYHSLYKFCAEVKDNNGILFRKADQIGFGFKRRVRSENYNNLKKLNKILIESNVTLNYIKNNEMLKKVISINDYTESINFNFDNINIVSEGIYKNKIFKVINNIVLYFNSKNDSTDKDTERIRINDSVTNYIKLLFDLSYDFVNDDLNNTFTLEESIIYSRTEDGIKINLESFNKFSDYNLFQCMYNVLIPIVARDLKVHRNVRERLRVMLYNILMNIYDRKSLVLDEDGILRLNYHPLIASIKEITQYKSKEIIVDNYLEDYYKYYNNYLDIRESEQKENFKTYNISSYILDFTEENKYVFSIGNEYIENNTKLTLYNNIASCLVGKNTYKNRIADLKYLLDEYNMPLKYLKFKPKYNIFEHVNEVYNLNLLEEINKRWKVISIDIVYITSLFVANMIYIIEGYSPESDFDGDEKSKELSSKLIEEYKKLLQKYSKSKDVQNIYESLTGENYARRSLSFNKENIIGFLRDNEYPYIIEKRYGFLYRDFNKDSISCKNYIKRIEDEIEEINLDENISHREKVIFNVLVNEIDSYKTKKLNDTIKEKIDKFIEEVDSLGEGQ